LSGRGESGQPDWARGSRQKRPGVLAHMNAPKGRMNVCARSEPKSFSVRRGELKVFG